MFSLFLIALQNTGAMAGDSYMATERILPFDTESQEVFADTFTFETDMGPLGLRTKMTRTEKTSVFNFYFPQNAANLKGVIFFFHGGGGDNDTWLRKNVESASLLSDAVLEGYGVIIPESLDRETSGWYWSDTWHNQASHTLSQYDDENLIRKINKLMIEQGFYTHATPVYLVGASNGCRMAQAMGSRLLVDGDVPVVDDITITAGTRADAPIGPIGQAVNVKAVAAYICKPDEDFLPGYITPTIFNHGKDDANNPWNEVEAFRAQVEQNQQAAGIANGTERNMSVPSALTRDQLTRVPGMSYPYARRLYKMLDDGGYLRPNGVLISVRNLLEDLLNQGDLTPEIHGDLQAQVERANAGHSVDSQWNDYTLRFFDHWR